MPCRPPLALPRVPRPHRGSSARARGFTLIEVLVALLIMAIMATMAWRGIDGLVRTREGAQAQGDRILRLTTVLGQWQQDLEQLQRTPAAPPLRFDGAALRLTRRAPDGLRLVVWTLQNGALYRWTSPPISSVQEMQTWWRRAQQWSTLQADALRVLDDVPSWQVYYYRMGDNAWSNAQSSAGTSAEAAASSASDAAAGTTDDDGAVPSGVRLVLQLPQGPLTRDLQLPPNP